MNADDKYSCRNMQNFLQQLQTLLSQKRKTFSWIFYCTTDMCMKFSTFSKKEWVSSTNYFRNYCFRNRFLLKRLKVLCFRTPFGNQRVNGIQNIAERCKAPLLSCFPMNFRWIELEEVRFFLILNLKTVC